MHNNILWFLTPILAHNKRRYSSILFYSPKIHFMSKYMILLWSSFLTSQHLANLLQNLQIYCSWLSLYKCIFMLPLIIFIFVLWKLHEWLPKSLHTNTLHPHQTEPHSLLLFENPHPQLFKPPRFVVALASPFLLQTRQPSSWMRTSTPHSWKSSLSLPLHLLHRPTPCYHLQLACQTPRASSHLLYHWVLPLSSHLTSMIN